MLVQSKQLKAGDAEFKAAVADVTQRLQETKGVDNVVGPYEAAGSLGRRAFGARDVRAAG